MVYFKSIQSLMKIKDRIFYASKKHTVYILTCMAVLMLVKNACWWKTCMLVKNLHQHSPPKFHDVGENNVGEIVCWRKKICSFKIICMLVNYVGENFDVCWWKVFLMTKYVCWWKMLVKNVCWWKIYVGEIISLKYACWWKLSPTCSFN